MKSNEKIKTLDEVVEIVERLKKDGKRIVTTNGCFDILHVGHVGGFEWAKAQGDVLIVMLNTDRSMRENKPLRPIVPENERASVLAGLEAIDYIVLFDDKTPIPCLERIRPDVHVKGSDYSIEQVRAVEGRTVEDNGGEVRLAPRIHPRSTTSIIEIIVERYGK